MKIQILRVAKEPIIRQCWPVFSEHLAKSNPSLSFHPPVANTEELESQIQRIHLKPTLVISDSSHVEGTKELLNRLSASKIPFKVLQMSGGDTDKHIDEKGQIITAFKDRLSPTHPSIFKIPQPISAIEIKAFFKNLQQLLRDEREQSGL